MKINLCNNIKTNGNTFCHSVGWTHVILATNHVKP